MHWRGLCFSIVSANSEVGLAAIITVLSNFGGWVTKAPDESRLERYSRA
jgi:hypothetical protein